MDSGFVLSGGDMPDDPRYIRPRGKMERRVAGLRDALPSSEISEVKVYSVNTGELLRIDKPNQRINRGDK